MKNFYVTFVSYISCEFAGMFWRNVILLTNIAPSAQSSVRQACASWRCFRTTLGECCCPGLSPYDTICLKRSQRYRVVWWLWSTQSTHMECTSHEIGVGDNRVSYRTYTLYVSTRIPCNTPPHLNNEVTVHAITSGESGRKSRNGSREIPNDSKKIANWIYPK